jgi:alkanesulfonate monooxygenase SsuD/methylene tetrahydromethanopterin reductase-like flavin-dependent oxidoreductase (luciferase family)
MPSPDRRRAWKMLPPSRSASHYAELARSAEADGWEGVFSIQLNSNPWVPLGAVAATTTELQLATGIALGFTRAPFETALAALDLDHLSEGRFTLGQGGFDGDFWHLDFSRLALKAPLRPNLPVWVAALRTPLVRVAGRDADGLIGHPSWSTRWALSQVEGPFMEAVKASGRQRGDVEVNLWHVAAPNPDVATSVEDARRHVATYASIAQYRPYFAAHGFEAEATALTEGAAAGRRDLHTIVPEEMARTFVLCGTPDQVRSQLEPLWAVADSLCLQPPPVGGDARAAYEAAIAELAVG